jgi:hypothetical protein
MLKVVIAAAASAALVVQTVAADVAAQQAKATVPSEDRVKELYFDAARAGRIDLLDDLIEPGMDVELRDAGFHTFDPPTTSNLRQWNC